MEHAEQTGANSEQSHFGEISEALEGVDVLVVRLELGIMETTLGAGAAGQVSGSYWSAPDMEVDVELERETTDGKTTASLRVHQHGTRYGWPLRSGSLDAGSLTLNLPTDIPLTLRVDTGVGETTLDLTQLSVDELRFDGGVGKSTITLPRRGSIALRLSSGVGRIDVERALDEDELTIRSLHIDSGVGKVSVELAGQGDFPVRIESGVGKVNLDVPSTLAARIQSRAGLGSVQVVSERFNQTGRNVWQSADYSEAANRAAIDVSTGIGAVTIAGT